jgi:hypothetical protein
MPSQREQYGGTVHLFIGMEHNPYKITSMPFTFGSSSIVIHRGLNSLFIFKSVSFSAFTPKLSYSLLRRCINLRILWASPTMVPIRVQRYLFTHYTPETLLNPIFEDLRSRRPPTAPKDDELRFAWPQGSDSDLASADDLRLARPRARTRPRPRKTDSTSASEELPHRPT